MELQSFKLFKINRINHEWSKITPVNKITELLTTVWLHFASYGSDNKFKSENIITSIYK